MNIFATHECPIQSAIYLDDVRKNKMLLETAQMLSTAINVNGGEAPYKSTHLNHPANSWLRSSKANYRWALRHYAALCRDFYRRRGRHHKSATIAKHLIKGIEYIPDGKLTPFVNCAANHSKGVSYKHIRNVQLAYQLYLSDRWSMDKKEPKWS